MKAHLLVEHCLGYLERMRKILVDEAYKKVFKSWVENNIIGLEIEFAFKSPTDKGFVPVRWRWVNAAMELREHLGGSISLEDIQRITKKQLKVRKLGFYGLTAKLF